MVSVRSEPFGCRFGPGVGRAGAGGELEWGPPQIRPASKGQGVGDSSLNDIAAVGLVCSPLAPMSG